MYPQHHFHGSAYNGMNHMVNQFGDMNLSGRGGSRGGRGHPGGMPRYPGVRMYRDDYRQDNRMDDHRRQGRFNDDDDDSFGGNSYYNRGGYSNRGRGGYQAMPPRGRRGGFSKFPQGGPPPHPQMGEFHSPPYGMRRGPPVGDYMGAGYEMMKDRYYPDRVSTHNILSAERYTKDWSKLEPKDPALEAKLYQKKFNQGESNFENWKNIPVETSGTNLPEPVSSFKDIGLGEILENNIELVGITQPTPVQMYSTSIVKANRDLMACAQTGSGKTAAFLIPILSNLFEGGPPTELREGTFTSHKVTPLVLILAPTRELASQIFEMTQHLCYRSCVRPYVVYGGSSIDKCIEALALGVEILVATPGRLIDLLNRGEVNLEMVRHLVLDEADRMLDMGFERDIRRIVTDYKMSGPGVRQTLMFSATFPKPIQILAKEFMEDYIFLTVGRVGSTSNMIGQTINYVRRSDKIQELIKVVTEEASERVLVFVRTKADTDKIQHVLTNEGFNAISIHGNKSQRMRENALGQFRNGEKDILVATEVAARGLDIPSISHVINFDMPDTIENYVHRIGRTGRMGNTGKATSFFGETDWHIAPGLTELLKESGQEVPAFLAKMKYDHSVLPQKKSSVNDKFGGRDYRRGPQYTQNIRYSNDMMKPPVRNYSTNPPNFYNQMPQFNHMSYGPGPYMAANSYTGGNFSNSREHHNSGPGRITPAGGAGGGQAGPTSQAQSGQSGAQQPLIPPALIPAGQATQQQQPQQQQQQPPQQNYMPPFNQLGTSAASDGLSEINSSPVPNPSTPAPAHFPLYASSNAAAIYNNQLGQFHGPNAFSPRNLQSTPAQFGQQPDMAEANPQNPAAVMRPFMIPSMANLAGLAATNMTGIPAAPTSWGAGWTQDAQ